MTASSIKAGKPLHLAGARVRLVLRVLSDLSLDDIAALQASATGRMAGILDLIADLKCELDGEGGGRLPEIQVQA